MNIALQRVGIQLNFLRRPAISQYVEAFQLVENVLYDGLFSPAKKNKCDFSVELPADILDFQESVLLPAMQSTYSSPYT